MGRSIIVMLAAGVATATATSASAGFFDVCEADPPGSNPTIVVTEDTVVTNETATFTDDPCCSPTTCSVEVADGVTLTLHNVRITPSPASSLSFTGGDGSRLVISKSEFDVCDSDVYGFSGGVRISYSTLQDPPDGDCDLMELEPDGDMVIVGSRLSTIYFMELVPANHLIIDRSKLEALVEDEGGIFIGTGFFAESRQTLVTRSTLKSSDNIEIGASEDAKVTNSLLDAETDITISAGEDTSVLRNRFHAEGTTTISGEASCTSLKNRPNVPCQP